MNKLLLLLLFPISISCFSQVKKTVNTCDALFKKTTDELTGEVSINSQKELFIYNKEKTKGISFYFSIDKAGILVMMEVFGAGNCIDKNAEIEFFFTDENQINQHNLDKFNCEKNASFYISMPDEKVEAEIFSSVSLKGIKAHTYKGVVSLVFTPSQQESFKNQFKCILEKYSIL